MNENDIDQMPAGPELDALCARAMGWEEIAWDFVPSGTGYTSVPTWRDPGGVDHFALPALSRDIKAAFTLDREGWLWNLIERPDYAYVVLHPYESLFYTHRSRVYWYETNGDRSKAFALAIARCAAKWYLEQADNE